MNFTSIFSKRISIAGIEVNDTSARLIQIVPGKTSNDAPIIKRMGEVDIPEGTIVASTVKDEAALAAALRQLVRVSRFSGNYAIGSIAIAEVYTKLMSFPRTLHGSKLTDAMNLTFEYQSPLNRTTGYADWETLFEGDAHEVLFAAAPKTVSDGYIRAFQQAGLKLIALEVHPQSLGRAIAAKPDDHLLYTSVSDTSASICVLKYRSVVFCRSLTEGPYDKKRIAEEERRVRESYESKLLRLKAAVVLDRAPIVKPFDADPRIKRSPGTWAIALGAALRGLLPRSEDSHVSLLPVGTEEAYSFQRANVFAEFIVDITLALSLFFAIAFIGSWLFMVRLQGTMNQQLSQTSSIAPPLDAQALEAKAKHFNLIAKTAATLLRTEPRWTETLTNIRRHIVPGVIAQSLALPSPDGTFSLSGVAQSRAALIALRTSFANELQFSDVDLPLNNLALKENIPFILSFKLRDPSAIYPH